MTLINIVNIQFHKITYVNYTKHKISRPYIIQCYKVIILNVSLSIIYNVRFTNVIYSYEHFNYFCKRDFNEGCK
jgi:hypothetical protein